MISVRLLVQICAVGSIAAVAACGGGGSSGSPTPIVSAPSVTGTSPTPTPTPTAGAGTLDVATPAMTGPVAVYAANASGTPAPLYTLAPTGFDTPTSLTTDSSGNVYVLNQNGGSILVFAKGATTATRTITSSALVGPEIGIAVGASGNVYVLGNVVVSGVGTTYGVAVFAPGAGANATPSQTFTNTSNAGVTGIAVDAAGTIYVGTHATTGNAILEFAATASGNATPTTIITGTSTQLGANGLGGIAVDASGNIYASVDQSTANATNAIVAFAAGATGNASPARALSGAATTLANPTSLALDSAGELLVQNAPSGAAAYVTVYPTSANGNIAPTRTIGEDVGGTSAGGGAIAAGS